MFWIGNWYDMSDFGFNSGGIFVLDIKEEEIKVICGNYLQQYVASQLKIHWLI